MSSPRLTPFEFVFQSVAESTFPAIRAALTESRQDPRDRDAFLMLRDVVALLHDLRPKDGLGEGIDQLAALIHHAYLFWEAGGVIVQVTSEQLAELLTGTGSAGNDTETLAFYTQLPERRIWAQVVPGQAHEPLDGFFQHLAPESGALRILGVFGMHPERQGFTVVEVTGSRPAALHRPDATPLFAPILPGGAAAGLYSIVGGEELLELGARVLELGAKTG
jgi:hypothetical protein